MISVWEGLADRAGTRENVRVRGADGEEARSDAQEQGWCTGMAVPISKAKFRGLGKTQMATGREWDDHMSATVEGVKLTLRDRPGGRPSRWVVCFAHT